MSSVNAWVGLLLIRGAPGVGKSSAAKFVAERIRSSFAIDIDHVRGMINSEEFIFGVDGDYLLALKATSKYVRHNWGNDGRLMIISDVLFGEYLDLFTDMLNDVPVKMVLLYADGDVLADRMQKRRNGYINIPVSVSINRKMMQADVCDELRIDTSDKSVNEVSALILKYLNIDEGT